MTFFEFFTQTLGVAAFLLSAGSFQAKSFKMINSLKIVSQILFTLHYLMLAAYTGMFMNIFSFIRGFVYIYLAQKNKSTLVTQIIFSLIFIVFGIFTWDGFISIFAITATVLQTIAYGIKKPAMIRLVNLPTCFLWMVYNLNYLAVGGLLSDIFSFVSIIIGVIRLDIPEYKNKKKV